MSTELRQQHDAVRARMDQIAAAQARRPVADDSAHLGALVKAEESHSPFTRMHTEKVALYTARLAEAMGHKPAEVSMFRDAARLHDVGKMKVSLETLNFRGQFSQAQRDEMKAHTTHGAAMLAEKPGKLAHMAAEMALYHHEAWDGSGYHGLRGRDIPYSARLCQVADVFEALTAERPYKKGMSPEDALAMMTREPEPGKPGLGRHVFDPNMLAAFQPIAAKIHAEGLSSIGHSRDVPELAEAAPSPVRPAPPRG